MKETCHLTSALHTSSSESSKAVTENKSIGREKLSNLILLLSTPSTPLSFLRLSSYDKFLTKSFLVLKIRSITPVFHISPSKNPNIFDDICSLMLGHTIFQEEFKGSQKYFKHVNG